MNNILDYGAGWLILFYGGAAAMRDGSGLSAGKLVTYQLYFTKIQNSYNTLIGLLSSFTRASGAAQRVLGLLRSMPGDGGGGAPPPPHAGTRGARLDYDDVSFSYASRPEKAVLRGLTLVVPAGSTLALVGRSGAGKTTALHMLLRFYEPTGGAIKIDGAALPTLDVRRLRRQFAIVAQETQLFDTTIGDDPGGHQTFETRPTGGRSPRRRQRRVRLRGRVGGRDPRGGRRGARGRVRGGLCGRVLRRAEILSKPVFVSSKFRLRSQVRDARRRARRAHLGGAEAANLHRSRVYDWAATKRHGVFKMVRASCRISGEIGVGMRSSARRDAAPPRNVHAAPRGGATTRPRGMSTWHPAAGPRPAPTLH